MTTIEDYRRSGVHVVRVQAAAQFALERLAAISRGGDDAVLSEVEGLLEGVARFMAGRRVARTMTAQIMGDPAKPQVPAKTAEPKPARPQPATSRPKRDRSLVRLSAAELSIIELLSDGKPHGLSEVLEASGRKSQNSVRVDISMIKNKAKHHHSRTLTIIWRDGCYSFDRESIAAAKYVLRVAPR